VIAKTRASIIRVMEDGPSYEMKSCIDGDIHTFYITCRPKKWLSASADNTCPWPDLLMESVSNGFVVIVLFPSVVHIASDTLAREGTRYREVDCSCLHVTEVCKFSCL